jgi:hypothetical protein
MSESDQVNLSKEKKQSNYREVEKINLFPGYKEIESPIIDKILSEAEFGSTYSLAEKGISKTDFASNKTETNKKPEPKENVKIGGEDNAKFKPLLPTATKTITKMLFQINTTARNLG